MLWYVIVGMLAAFGLLCAGWMVYGLMISRGNGTLLVIGENAPEFLCRCDWLREMGLLNCRLAVWDAERDSGARVWLESRNIEIWDAAKLADQLGIGANEHGAGTGDSPGCHQCGGVSEL